MTGWERLTDFDGRYPYGMSQAGNLGGSSNHSHEAGHFHTIPSHGHSGSSGSTGPSATRGVNTDSPFSTAASFNHTHTVSIATQSNASLGVGSLPGASVAPPYISVIMIEADGTEDIPENSLAWFDGFTAPNAEWEIYSAADGRIMRGASTDGDGGSTGGAGGAHDHGDHSHIIGSHTHALTMTGGATTNVTSFLGATTDYLVSHAHPTSADTDQSDDASSTGSNDSAEAIPPHLTLLPLRSTAAVSTVPTGLIVGWYGLAEDIPFGYEPCDGLDGRPDLEGRFVLGDTSGEQVLGGSSQHTHSIPDHTHTTGHNHNAPSGTLEQSENEEVTRFNGGSTVSDYEHTHTFTGFATGSTSNTSGSTSGTSGVGSNLPSYTSLIWIVKVREFFGDPPRRRYNPHRILPYRERVR